MVDSSATPSALKPVSPLLLRGFTLIALRRLRRAFRAVRVLHPERLRDLPPGPAVVVLNHPSWWDPLVCLALARRLLPRRVHRAPISAASLQQYGLFRHMGMFPVEQHALRGAAQFLRAATAALAAGDVLWVTAQGHFTDVRARPLELKPGTGALLQRTPRVTVLPLALEYTFWNARLPEVLVCAGEPFTAGTAEGRDGAEWTHILEERLQAAQDELASAAQRRSGAAFQTLLTGARGVAGIYGAWQRLRGGAGSTDPLEDL